MNITNIANQVKNPNRYSIFVDGAYSFSLSAETLLDSGLVRGQELSPADVVSYKKLSADDKAYGLALAYVARRMRSEGELRDYFRRKQYADELSEQLLSKLKRGGWVNDTEFAERWVENRRNLRSSSAKKLRLELQQKHIARDVIDAVLAADPTDETGMLRDLVERKRKQLRYQDDQKLMQYPARQGFRYDDIKTAMQALDEES